MAIRVNPSRAGSVLAPLVVLSCVCVHVIVQKRKIEVWRKQVRHKRGAQPRPTARGGNYTSPAHMGPWHGVKCAGLSQRHQVRVGERERGPAGVGMGRAPCALQAIRVQRDLCD